jgi:UDP-glucose 4-epimerase
LCVQLITQPFVHSGVRVYNIGSGQGTSLNQLCSLIEQITQQPVLREYYPARAVDVRRIVLNCQRIRQDYHWTAHTDLLTGLDETWQWFITSTH